MIKPLQLLVILLTGFIGVNGFVRTPSAGEWTKLTDLTNTWELQQHEGCTLKFTGEIRSGDLTEALRNGIISERGHQICLNSTGGSFQEVVKFVRQTEGLYRHFSTHVEKGSKCLSACALLFMFGLEEVNSNYNQYSPSRTLHRGAILGFHSPSIRSNVTNQVNANEYFSGGLQVADLLLDYNYSSGEISDELMKIILSTPGDEFFIVNTYALAQLLNINIDFDYRGCEGFWEIRCSGRFLNNGYEPAVIANLVRNVCITSEMVRDRRTILEKGFDFGELSKVIMTELYRPNYPKIVYIDEGDISQFTVGPRKENWKFIIGTLGPIYDANFPDRLRYCRIGIWFIEHSDGIQLRELTAEVIHTGNAPDAPEARSKFGGDASEALIPYGIAPLTKEFSSPISQDDVVIVPEVQAEIISIPNEEPSWQQIFSEDSVIHLGDENIRDWPTLHGRCYDLTLPNSEGATQFAITFEPYGLERVTVYSSAGNFRVGSQKIISGSRPNYWGQRVDVVIPISTRVRVVSYTVNICSETLDGKDYDDLMLRNIGGWVYR